MLLTFKTQTLRLLLIIPFLFLGNKVEAQNQYLNDAYANGFYYYSNGQYQSVYNALVPHVNSMEDPENFDYYKRTQDGVGMVFRVYKMIIESEYALNQFERAEWFENYVINYFGDIYSPEQVLDRLDYARL